MWHLASDEAYTFFGVVISRHVREEFVTKCREEGFVTRHFVSTKENIRTKEEELKAADGRRSGNGYLTHKVGTLISLAIALDRTAPTWPEQTSLRHFSY